MSSGVGANRGDEAELEVESKLGDPWSAARPESSISQCPFGP